MTAPACFREVHGCRWVVERLALDCTRLGRPYSAYPYLVAGHHEDTGESFRWHVPTDPRGDPDYVTTDAVIVPEREIWSS